MINRGRSDAQSLTQRIRSDIEAAIMSGELRPGDRIPIEHELAAKYGCARMTVTRATEALAQAGLIVRRKRAGSFVAQPRIESAVLDIPDIQANVQAQGKRYGIRLLARRLRPADASEHERQLAGKGDLLDIACLHLADDRAFALEHRLISLTAVPDAIDADFTTIPPGTWLLGHVPWTEAEHRIGARGADEASAAALGIARGTACLVIERRTWRGETHITRVRQTFPGDTYDLVARFAPQNDAR